MPAVPRGEMPDYRNVRAYAPSEALSVEVHRLVPLLPARRSPGLPAQLCRAASSIPANIVEGSYRETQLEFARFLAIARGSAGELAVHLRLVAALDAKLNAKALAREAQANLVAAMLTKLIARIRERERARNDDIGDSDIGYPTSNHRYRSASPSPLTRPSARIPPDSTNVPGRPSCRDRPSAPPGSPRSWPPRTRSRSA